MNTENTETKSFGQTAYETYCEQSQWKSLVSGAPLPQWPEVKPEIQDAWEHAGDAVADCALDLNDLGIDSASVKVMRSHDYCHFEVCLSSNLSRTPMAVDALRKDAARLADKAVEQYKVAKHNAQRMDNDRINLIGLRYRLRNILAKPESERTPEEKAVVKTIEDRAHHNPRRYNYEDGFEEDEDYPDDDQD